MKLLKRNYLYQIFGKTFPQGLSFISQILLAKFAGIETFGKYSIIVVYWMTSQSIIGEGINTVFQKKHDENLIFQASFYRLIVSVLIAFLLCPILVFLEMVSFKTFLVLCIGFISMHLIDIELIFFRIINKDIFVTYQKSGQVLLLFLMILLLQPSSLQQFSIYFSISWLVIFIISSINLIALNRFKLIEQLFVFFKYSNLKLIILIGISLFATLMYGNSDFIILDRVLGNSISSQYRLSALIAGSPLMITSGVFAIYLSKLAISAKNKKKYQFIVHIKNQLLINIVVFIGFFLVSFILLPLINIVIPTFSLHSFRITRVLLISNFLNTTAMLFSYILLVLDKQKYNTFITIILVPISFMSGFILVSILGEYGAVLNQIFIYLYLTFLMWRKAKSYLWRNKKCVE